MSRSTERDASEVEESEGDLEQWEQLPANRKRRRVRLTASAMRQWPLTGSRVSEMAAQRQNSG